MNSPPHTPTPTSPAFPKEGSSLYHAIRLTPFTHRPAIECWVNWWHEVSRIPFEVSDADVAESKLRWWAQEIRQTMSGQPRHPLMQLRASLDNLPGGAQWPESDLWMQQIEGLIQLVHQTRWLDDATLQRHIRLTTSAMLEGAACLLGATSPAARSAAGLLGAGLRQAHQLARLGQDARLGWVNVSIDVLQTHDVRAHQLSKPVANQAPSGWPSLLKHLSNQAHASLEQGLEALNALNDKERKALKPIAALAHIYAAQVSEIAKQGDRILHERILLTPMRKWWISQRVQWQWLK